jgi:flagellin
MSFSVLNNIPALAAENQLSITQNNLQTTLFQLSSGSRINSGSDDPAGLAIANGLQANIVGLTQSVQNANSGVGALQVADGALAQVTTLLNRAVTLATEAGTGTVSAPQQTSLDNEYQSILNEIGSIGANTTYNGQAVFSNTTTSVFLSDATATGTSTIAVATGALTTTTLGLNGTLLQDVAGGSGTNAAVGATNAQAALTKIDAAVQTVANQRGNIGAGINQLNAASNVITAQVQNLTSAEDGITAANIPQVVGNLSQFEILAQTGIAALAQANTQQQLVLNLLH